MKWDKASVSWGAPSRWRCALMRNPGWGRMCMTRKSAERAVGELLDGYQAVLDDIEGRFDAAELTEEDWLIRDASIARIDAACQVLELLDYAVRRGSDGGWLVSRG